MDWEQDAGFDAGPPGFEGAVKGQGQSGSGQGQQAMPGHLAEPGWLPGQPLLPGHLAGPGCAPEQQDGSGVAIEEQHWSGQGFAKALIEPNGPYALGGDADFDRNPADRIRTQVQERHGGLSERDWGHQARAEGRNPESLEAEGEYLLQQLQQEFQDAEQGEAGRFLGGFPQAHLSLENQGGPAQPSAAVCGELAPPRPPPDVMSPAWSPHRNGPPASGTSAAAAHQFSSGGQPEQRSEIPQALLAHLLQAVGGVDTPSLPGISRESSPSPPEDSQPQPLAREYSVTSTSEPRQVSCCPNIPFFLVSSNSSEAYERGLIVTRCQVADTLAACHSLGAQMQ